MGWVVAREMYPELFTGEEGEAIRLDRIHRHLLNSRSAIISHLVGAKLSGEEDKKEIRQLPLPRYYPITAIKKGLISEPDEDIKYRFSQMIGVLETKSSLIIPMYACAGKDGVVFRGSGEEKMFSTIKTQFPASIPSDICAVICDSDAGILDTLRDRKKIRRKDLKTLTEKEKELNDARKITEKYLNVHFFPLSEDGINSFKLFLADVRGVAISRLLCPGAEAYYSPENSFEYDARIGDTVYVQALTGNWGKLKRIASYVEMFWRKALVVYCFESQKPLLNTIFKNINGVELVAIPDIALLMSDLNAEYGMDLSYYSFKY